MLISGEIAGGLGWEAVFYIQGGLSTIWLVAWVILAADTPEKQIFISQTERDFITNSLKTEDSGPKVVCTYLIIIIIVLLLCTTKTIHIMFVYIILIVNAIGIHSKFS